MSRIDYRPHPTHTLWGLLFESVTDVALRFARENPDKVTEPLLYLDGAEYPGDCELTRLGATYKSLAYVGHRVGMDGQDRQDWYDVAAGLPLSQAHVGIIIEKLNAAEQTADKFQELLNTR